jgi:hypothetical protein
MSFWIPGYLHLCTYYVLNYDFYVVNIVVDSSPPPNSLSIVSDYRLEDRATGVQFPAEAKDFSSILCVQTSSEAHSASQG